VEAIEAVEPVAMANVVDVVEEPVQIAGAPVEDSTAELEPDGFSSEDLAELSKGLLRVVIPSHWAP
jgi:hypothetical protein